MGHHDTESQSTHRRASIWWLWLLAALFVPLVAAPSLASAVRWPVHSTITRMMIVTCGSVVLCWHGLPHRNRIRTAFRATHVRSLGLAIGIAVSVCVLYSGGLMLLGAEAPRPFDAIHRPDRLLSGLGIGLLVSLVEEPIFRLLLPRILSIRGHLVVGAGLSSALYALAHYLRPDEVPRQNEYSLSDSLAVYQDMFSNLLAPFSDPAPGLGLFLFGVLLCSIAHRRGLAWTIGIHASAVYYQKADSCLVYWNHHGRHPFFGTFEVKYDGAMFWILCGVLLLLSVGIPTAAAPRGSETRKEKLGE